MAKKCMLKREKKRQLLSKKYIEKRNFLRKIINDVTVSMEEKESAQEKMQKLPRDSASFRLRNRCWQTGRPRGVYRFVGLCRNMFRIQAMFGNIPGLRKASW